MQLSAPKQITFWVAVVVALVGLVSSFVAIPVLSGFAFWIVVLGFVILAAANLMEGL
jgi:threonine/homoserine/homoserine lactone efflux protein